MTGATIFGCLGPSLTADEAAFFREADPFGFILFARNLQDPEQIRNLTGDLRAAVGRDAPIFIDQEGGRVARLRPPHWQDWLPALEQVARSRSDFAARGMYLRARIIAAELIDLGIDGNCVPIVDVPTPDVHEIIRNRCYGEEPQSVAEIGRAVARGCLDGGVLPVLKHIPGHGRPDVDSHVGLPVTDVSLDILQKTDFCPFRMLNDLPLGMTAHVVYPAIDPDNCATFSGDVLDLVRKDIGFDGLLMSDDISMGALTGSFRKRASRALDAGCDVILHCHAGMEEMVQIAEAAGRLEGLGKRRAKAALAVRKPPRDFSVKQALAELACLLKMPPDERD